MNNTSRRPAAVRHASDFRTAVSTTSLPLQINDRRVSSANDDITTRAAEGDNPLTAGLRPQAVPQPARVMGAPRKARRSIEQVLSSLPTEYDEAAYALQRIAANDLRTQKVLNTVSSEALPHILKQRPDLSRFFTKN